MEVAIPITMLVIYGSLALIAVIALVYFIVKRIEDKKKETFEDRDN